MACRKFTKIFCYTGYYSTKVIQCHTKTIFGLISIFEGNEQIFEGKDDYIKSVILLNDSFSKIRLTQIEI